MKSIFDYIAPLYSKIEKSILSSTRKKILKKVTPREGDNILDIGGGTGSLLEQIKSNDTELFLLDESRGMMKQSPKTNQRILGRACRNPFESNTFDTILCIDALHHFQNKTQSLHEMVRTVKPGGKIIILEFDSSHPVTKFIKFGEKLFGESSSFFKPTQLSNFFKKKDLKTKVDRINSYEYIIIAEKPDHNSQDFST